MMKKIWKTIAAMTTTLMLSACSSTSGTTASAGSSSIPSTTETASEPTTLVVVYSATGNTMEAAEIIANETGAEIFEIEPENPYSSEDLNYSDPDSRVSKEHDDPALRQVALQAVQPENWENVDTVYLGYPIWWGIAAWPVSSFVEGVDFNGKTVYPFCTSASSGLGSSAEDLQAAANGGDWEEGIRFSSSPNQEEVVEWVQSQ